MEAYFLFFLAVLPVIILLYYIYKQDINKEPRKLLYKAFGGGVLAALIITFGLMPVRDYTFPGPLMTSLYSAFGCAAIPEEGLKFVMLYWVIWRSKEFDEFFDGMVYAVFVSMGFACFENILYVFNYGSTIALSRALFAVPAHFLFGVIMGYYLALSRFDVKRRGKYMAMSIVYPMLAHGCYDFLLMYAENVEAISPALSGVAIIVFYIFVYRLWKIGLRKIKNLDSGYVD